MTEQSPESAQFFLTTQTPCPYLEGKQERKLFTHLSGRRAQMMHFVLSDHGFRRSQNLIYRPAWEGCAACKSVRIVVDAFSNARRHKRIRALNRNVTSSAIDARATPEQYDLFKRYLIARHPGGGMTQMSYTDYEYMVEDTPVETMIVEYRTDRSDGHRLAGVALTDLMPDGLSMVYSFFDPDLPGRGMGNFMILDHVDRVRGSGQNYVYLGYWVKGSPKMAYKSTFGPLEVQRGAIGWQRLTASELS